jgi:hypothetical protein
VRNLVENMDYLQEGLIRGAYLYPTYGSWNS